MGSLYMNALAKDERQRLHDASATSHSEQNRAPDFLPSRHLREPRHDHFEIAFDRSEVGARLIGLAQSEGVGGRAAGMPEDG